MLIEMSAFLSVVMQCAMSLFDVRRVPCRDKAANSPSLGPRQCPSGFPAARIVARPAQAMLGMMVSDAMVITVSIDAVNSRSYASRPGER
jgi:hypothetical protein